MSATEVNFDGLVGPTHNYGGLSVGNVASMASGGDVSNPRAAALQGLAKMRTLIGLGLTQGLLPPQERPAIRQLRAYGFSGADADVIAAAGRQSPALLANLSSASAMWTANAATVSPAADTADGRVHFTPANLSAMFHRSIEADATARALKTIFPEGDQFTHHAAVPAGGAMGDEGAANHGRLCNAAGEPGVELFVYGRSAFERLETMRFAPRQAQEASAAVARHHGVFDRSVFVRQSSRAIEAGAFHNDVVSVTNDRVLFFHEHAFDDKDNALAALRAAAMARGIDPIFIEVPDAAVPLADAIKSYLFNSQLITLPTGGMALILPTDASETRTTSNFLDALVRGNGPVREVHFFDLKQSMKNGGGPACLRLRVVLDATAHSAVLPGALLNAEKISAIEALVTRHYRDRLGPDDLRDPQLLLEQRTALDELTGLMGLGALYDFQRD